MTIARAPASRPARLVAGCCLSRDRLNAVLACVTRHKAWIEHDWEARGISWVVVARERTPDLLEIGMFLVDAWCLGVKDAFALEMSRSEFEPLLDEQIPESRRESIEPPCARKLIEGAVAYAQGMGFLPFRDFRKARKVLGGIDAGACAREFIFGYEGRPCFVVGPDDDDARINRVVAILTARFGEHGFGFVDPDSETDEDVNLAIDAFFRFIEDGNGPDKAFTSFEAEGFIAALLVQPDVILPSEWIPAMWGGEQAVPEFPDDATARDVVNGMMTFYNEVGGELTEAVYRPVLQTDDEPDQVSMMGRYCVGFLRGLALRPSTVTWLRGHPDTREAMEMIEALSLPDADPARWIRPDAEAVDVLGAGIAWLHRIAKELRQPGPTE